MEVSTLLAPSSSQRISLNRTEFSATDFRFFVEKSPKRRKYLRFPSDSKAIKLLTTKTLLHNPSTILHNHSTIPYNPSTTLHNHSTIQAPGIAKRARATHPFKPRRSKEFTPHHPPGFRRRS
jgi:hypothetical protein